MKQINEHMYDIAISRKFVMKLQYTSRKNYLRDRCLCDKAKLSRMVGAVLRTKNFVAQQSLHDKKKILVTQSQ